MNARRTIGIVDYGVGNQASVWRALHSLGYRCRVSRDPAVLDATDVILLPGVGAFGAAMEQLHRHDLVGFLQERGRSGKPFIGLCLGMQLLADISYELGTTVGLGLIPGEVKPFAQDRWHIGWNSIEARGAHGLLAASDGQAMYFNHSFVFDAPEEYVACVARLNAPFTVGVKRGKLVGLQFHPEKSQMNGRLLLRNVVEQLCAGEGGAA